MPTPDYISIYQNLAAKILPSHEIIKRIFYAASSSKTKDPEIKINHLNTAKTICGTIQIEDKRYAFDIKFRDVKKSVKGDYVFDCEVLFWARADPIESFQ